MSLNSNTLSFARITTFDVRVGMRSGTVAMCTNDFSGDFELSSAIFLVSNADEVEVE
jgi:hypothetical protein